MISVCVLVLKFLKKTKFFESDFYRLGVKNNHYRGYASDTDSSVPAHR